MILEKPVPSRLLPSPTGPSQPSHHASQAGLQLPGLADVPQHAAFHAVRLAPRRHQRLSAALLPRRLAAARRGPRQGHRRALRVLRRLLFAQLALPVESRGLQ